MAILHAAAKYHNRAIIELLLDAGSAIDSRDNSNRTALWYACIKDNVGATKLLIDRNADLGSITGVDDMGRTILLNMVFYPPLL